MKKLRILFVSLICILLLVLAVSPALPVAADAPAPAPAPAPVLTAASEAPGPALFAAPAPAIELTEYGAAMDAIGLTIINQAEYSVAQNTSTPVSAESAQLYVLAAGLILITIVASIAYFRRIISSIGHSIAGTFSPGTGVNRQCYVAGGQDPR